MSRVFSFRDLLRLNIFAGLNEVSLLQIQNDSLVNCVLADLGFDITKPILYVPAKHRDLSGHVAVGYRAVGDINPHDRTFLNSSLCLPIERLIAASKTDMSLTRELAKLLGSTVELRDDGAVDEADDYPEELTEPDEEQVANEILVLENLRDFVRGSPYNEQGALKTPQEYQ